MNETTILSPDADFAIDDRPIGASKFYEVINGRVVEPPEMAAYESLLATALAEAIGVFFAGAGRLGRTAVETLFRLNPDSGPQRQPDVAFVSYDRWPRDRPVPRTAAWDVVPDLAVEVVSPGDLAVELLDKLDDYHRAGVRLVWVIDPRHGRVFVHEGPKGVTVLDGADTLDGGAALPGFRLPLGGLFEGRAGPAGRRQRGWPGSE